MKNVLQYIGSRLTEKSTWCGITMTLQACHIPVPEPWNTIIGIWVVFLGGMLAAYEEK